MKPGWPALIAVSVLSSLTTLAVMTWLGSRDVRADGEPRPVTASSQPSAVRVAEPNDPLVAPSSEGASGPSVSDIRLAELERRVSALEASGTSESVGNGGRRALAGEPSNAEGEALREQVLGWIAEEREARRAEQARQDEADRARDLKFQVDYTSLKMAKEHGLADWQQTRLAEVFLEIETRRREIDEGIDPRTQDPAEIEARWEEFDTWADARFREELGPDLYERLFGEH